MRGEVVVLTWANRLTNSKAYCRTTTIVGWLLIIMGISGLLMTLFGVTSADVFRQMSLAIFKRAWAKLCLTGLAALWVSQFMTHLLNGGSQPSWFVRSGSTLLYICAIVVILRAVPMVIHSAGQWLVFLALILLNFARALIFVGLAKVFQRILI